MKKHYIFAVLFAIFTMAGFSQVTITGWTFPVNSGPDSLNANLGLPGNLGYDLRFESEDSTYNTVSFVNGASTFAAATFNWDNGADFAPEFLYQTGREARKSA